MKALNIIKYIFTIVGVGMLVGASFLYKNTSEFLKNSIETEGEVIEMIRSRSSSNESLMYKPLVQFYDVNGNVIEFASSVSSSSPSYGIGEKVAVLYTAESPNKAKIKGFFTIWGGILILGIMGAVFSAVGLSFFIYRKRKENRLKHLKQNGKRIEADFKNVILNRSLTVNGRNPYQVIAQWQNPATSKLYVFSSENIWFDPTEFVNTDKIKVLIDKKNPKIYQVDISFLPELA
ncbi:DUF3592 domain-containing protein [Polaribacter sp.]|uniref:DUF3592 domain-containing protein n=1 Tax=Polaribacter sp. TaxID=1920175 RepID=UPI003EF2C83F